jgi:hypothetical protein
LGGILFDLDGTHAIVRGKKYTGNHQNTQNGERHPVLRGN